MTKRSFSIISKTRMELGESPLWDPDSGVLYWIDILKSQIHRFHTHDQTFTVWTLPSEPGCICLRRSGGLIVAMRSGIASLDTNDGSLTLLTDAPYDTNKIRFNDGRCDSVGRLWLGTLVDSRATQDGRLFSFAHGRLHEFNIPVTVSNGIAFSPDFSFFFHSDTTAHKINRYRFDLSSGNVSSPCAFKTFSLSNNSSYLGRPDGAAVDSEGFYWVAMYEGGCVLRLSSNGDIAEKIDVPLRCPTMVAFGGDDLKTLFVTSSSHNRSNAELVNFPLSGFLLSTDVEVSGLAEFPYVD